MARKAKLGFGDQATTLVARGTRVTGDILFRGSLEVEGEIAGNVTGEAEAGAQVRVLKEGVICGEVRVPVVVISGRVRGDVYAGEQVHLTASAEVEGNVHYALLEVERGARVSGKLMPAAAGSGGDFADDAPTPGMPAAPK